MADASTDLDLLTAILRSLTSGVDPGRLLQEVVAATAKAAGATHVCLMGCLDGGPATLAKVGTTPRLVAEVAEAAIVSKKPARKTAGGPGLHAEAEPIRIGLRVVGALAVGGTKPMDVKMLPTFAAAAALVLAHRPPPPSAGSAVEALAAAAQIAADPDEARVLVRAFVAAERLFEATAGFCAITDGGSLRVAHLRGIERSRMLGASRRAEFRAFVTSPCLRVDEATHPVVGSLTDGLPTAVGIPLVVGGHRLGQLVLLVAEPPGPPVRALMEAFAAHVALGLRSADAHRSAREKEDQLRSIVHAVRTPILVADACGRFEVVNAAAAELLHLSDAFEVGQPVGGRLGDEVLEKLLTGETAGPAEVVIGASAPRVYRATVANVSSGGRPERGRILVLDDVTRRAEADQLKSDFAAVVGHELRTPLTVVKGYITLLQQGADLDAAARATAVDALAKSADRLERLVEDLLFATAIETSPPVVALDDVDLRTLVEERAGDRVKVMVPAAPVWASIDQPKLDYVLSHLIDNALKCSGADVVVELADRGVDIEVAVVDAGEGIFSGDIAKLFDRFHQVDGSSTRSHGGTGMGLYLCRRLVELQGGRIWCESRLGVGSRFAVRLPKTAPAVSRSLHAVDATT